MTLRRTLPGLLMAIACGALLAIPFAAHAQPVPASESKSLHEWATLVPTTSGSVASLSGTADFIYFPFKTGSVDLAASLRGGATCGSIGVTVTGYAAGAYDVFAVTESSTTDILLGTLTVTTGTFPILSGSGIATPQLKTDDVAKPDYIIVPWEVTSGHAVFGDKSNPFPDGFDPFDVGSVFIAGPLPAPGNTAADVPTSPIVASASLDPVTNGYYTALSPLVAGASDSGAKGYALIHASKPPLPIVTGPIPLLLASSRPSVWTGPVPIVPPIIIDPLPPILGARTGQLVIHAHGLPAGATVTYAADGAALGTATTDASGNLAIHACQGHHGTLPATLDLFSIKTVTVKDASGAVLVSASF